MEISNIQLPNLVISGVVKGGTTSLYTYLSYHPEICCSSVKETCYFSSYRYGQLDSRYQTSADPLKQYQNYFNHCNCQKLIMEATPGYFEGGKRVAQEMKSLLGADTKVLIVLREPVSRLISFFKYKKSMLLINKALTLNEYIEQCNDLPYSEKVKQENDTYWGIEGGYYTKYLDDWFECFGDSLKILFFDDLVSNPKSLLQDLSIWLEIDSTPFSRINFSVENKSVRHRNKHLQKLALIVNHRTEQFWRSHPNLKKQVRNVYYSINGSNHQEIINETLISDLKLLYKPYNRKLSQQLLEQGYNNLPQWLISSID